MIPSPMEISLYLKLTVWKPTESAIFLYCPMAPISAAMPEAEWSMFFASSPSTVSQANVRLPYPAPTYK